MENLNVFLLHGFPALWVNANELKVAMHLETSPVTLLRSSLFQVWLLSVSQQHRPAMFILLSQSRLLAFSASSIAALMATLSPSCDFRLCIGLIKWVCSQLSADHFNRFTVKPSSLPPCSVSPAHGAMNCEFNLKHVFFEGREKHQRVTVWFWNLSCLPRSTISTQSIAA